VETVNKMVLEGVPFREAYRRIGMEIENGTYHADRQVSHTHEGSIGNLCTDGITALMDEVVSDFHFDEVAEAEQRLVQ
jgi:argininosuccinate lyase